MEFDNIETVKRAVEIDAGVSIVPQGTVAQEIAKQTLAAVTLEDGEFSSSARGHLQEEQGGSLARDETVPRDSKGRTLKNILNDHGWPKATRFLFEIHRIQGLQILRQNQTISAVTSNFVEHLKTSLFRYCLRMAA